MQAIYVCVTVKGMVYWQSGMGYGNQTVLVYNRV